MEPISCGDCDARRSVVTQIAQDSVWSINNARTKQEDQCTPSQAFEAAHLQPALACGTLLMSLT